MTAKVSPWLEEAEAANISEASGLSVKHGPLWSHPQAWALPARRARCCHCLPYLAPSLELLPCQACPFVVATVVFSEKYLWSSIILRFLEERYYVNENQK